MTEEQKIDFAEKLSHIEERSKSNTRRLDKVDEAVQEQNNLIGAIKELAVETKYMREDLNRTIKRLDKLESQDGAKWDNFKWLIVAGVVTVILSYLAVQLGLK